MLPPPFDPTSSSPLHEHSGVFVQALEKYPTVDILAYNAGLLQAVEIPVMKDWQWWLGDMSQDWAGHGIFGGWNAPCGVAESLHLVRGSPDTYRGFLSL